MQLLTVLISFTLFFTALALPTTTTDLATTDRRDLTTIWQVLNKITDSLTAMNKTIEKFNGDPIDAVPILDAASATLKELTDNLAKMKTTEELNLITSIPVLYPVYYLNAAVDSVTSQLVAKKALFEKAGMDFIVKEKLNDFVTIAGDFITATLSKIPNYLGIISSPIGYYIKNHINTAAKAFGITVA
jgi:Hydrophobic surface binding protein A